MTWALTACGQQPLEQRRQEGKKVTRLLIKDLRKVRSRDDLVQVAPELEKHFSELAQVMLAARKIQRDLPERDEREFSSEDQALSEELRIEVSRVFQIEGGRSVIEQAQQPALGLLTN